MRRTMVSTAALITGAVVLGWAVAARRLAHLEAELDRPDLERFASARRLAELEGGVVERHTAPRAA